MTRRAEKQKQKKFIITSFFVLMFSLISCGCEFSSPSMPAEQYGFSIISSNQYPYVNIDSMQNKEIEAQINSLLKNVPVCLLKDLSGWIKDSKVEVVFQTEDYLSILYSVSLNDEETMMRPGWNVNRAALIGKFNQSMSSGNMGDMSRIICLLSSSNVKRPDNR